MEKKDMKLSNVTHLSDKRPDKGIKMNRPALLIVPTSATLYESSHMSPNFETKKKNLNHNTKTS